MEFVGEGVDLVLPHLTDLIESHIELLVYYGEISDFNG